MKHFFTLLCLLFPLLAQSAELLNDCGEVETPIPYGYCITKTKGSQNTDVLYYLHGGGGNEKQWIDSGSGVRNAWKKSNFAAPVVITVSFGPLWLLVKKNSLETSALLDFFRGILMPELEMRALGKPATRRLLAGASMGGFNVAQLLINMPGAFQRAALTCSAFANISPWASDAEVAKFAKRVGVPADAIKNISEIAQAFVPDETSWQREVSPLDLALTNFGPNSPVMLVAGNKADKTFYEGSQLFYAAVKSTGAPVTWQSWPGKHCDWNDKAVAEFLRQK